MGSSLQLAREILLLVLAESKRKPREINSEKKPSRKA
jgi:hypothetical protein